LEETLAHPALSDETVGYISAVLQEMCRTFLFDEGAASRPLCCIIGVGAKKVWPCVKSTAARMTDSEASCQKVSDLRPRIKLDD
jgi:hypothetical protein